MIELRHIRYFIAVAEELHFGRAAQRLHIAQPGLSQQIQQLENELGVRLLERNQRKVELTAAGQTFLSEGRRALGEVERAIKLARTSAHGETASLRLGAADSAVLTVLPSLLREYRRQFPQIELVIRELPSPYQIDAIARGDLDVGFVRPPVKTNDMAFFQVSEEPIGIYMPEDHPLAAKKRVKLSSLANEPLILHPALRPSWADFMIGICRAQGFEPISGHVANETTAALSLVAAGLGVTFIPETLRELERPGIVYRPFAPPVPTTKLLLVHRAGKVPKPVADLVSIARSIYD